MLLSILVQNSPREAQHSSSTRISLSIRSGLPTITREVRVKGRFGPSTHTRRRAERYRPSPQVTSPSHLPFAGQFTLPDLVSLYRWVVGVLGVDGVHRRNRIRSGRGRGVAGLSMYCGWFAVRDRATLDWSDCDVSI